MTREEALEILRKHNEWRRYIGPLGERPEMTEPKTLGEAIDVITSQPSLPANVDEAAINYAYDGEPEKYGIEFAESNGNNLRDDKAAAFKAGAEWMAGQFQKIEGELVDWYSTSEGKDYCCGIKTSDPFVVPEGFYIRKK